MQFPHNIILHKCVTAGERCVLNALRFFVVDFYKLLKLMHSNIIELDEKIFFKLKIALKKCIFECARLHCKIISVQFRNSVACFLCGFSNTSMLLFFSPTSVEVDKSLIAN